MELLGYDLEEYTPVIIIGIVAFIIILIGTILLKIPFTAMITAIVMFFVVVAFSGNVK